MANIDYILNSTNINSYVVKINRIPITDRNSNFEPILSSLKIETKQDYSFAISIGQTLIIEIDSTPQYQGRVKKVTPDNSKKTYIVEVEHGLFDLTKKKVDYPTLFEAVFTYNIADFSSPKTITDIADTVVGLYIEIAAGHGLATGVWTPIAFRFTTDPDNDLIANKYFYGLPEVAPGESDITKWLKIREVPNVAYLNDPLGLAGLLLNQYMTDNIDIDKYNHYDNETYPNLSLLHLFECFGSVLGVTFDYTDIASWVVHTISSTNYTWDEILLDENMLYALNQSQSMFHDTIDEQGSGGSRETDYRDRRINLFELFSYILSVFGFSLHYKTTDTWEILKPSNSLYSYLPKEYYVKRFYTVEGEPNTAYGEESWNARSSYISGSTPTDLTDGYKMDALLSGNINNVNNVDYISNLKFLIRGSTSGSVLTSNYFRIDNATSYRQVAIQNDFDVQEISSPIKDGIYTIKRHFVTVDLSKGKRSNVIQED